MAFECILCLYQSDRRTKYPARTADRFNTWPTWPDPKMTHLAARPLELLPCLCFLRTGHGCLRSRLGPDGKTQARHTSVRTSQVAKQPNTKRHWTWLESGSCSPANRPSMCLAKCLLRVHSPQRYSVQSTQMAQHNKQINKKNKGKHGKRPTSPKEDLLTAACCLATPAPAASPASSAPLEPPEPCFRPAHSAQGPPLVC